MFIVFTLLLVVICSGWFFYRQGKKKAIRQCSYGSLKVYEILQNTADYDLLREQLNNAETFEERYLYSVSISRIFPLDVLERWTNEEPNSADALLCYGARLVQWSWDARGYGRGAQVSQERWLRFYERLDKTRNVLTRCAEAMPTDPTPWAYLIMVSTWHGDNQATRASYFDEAIKRDPCNWAAHIHMVIALSEKWGGDNERMISFAEEVSNAAPTGTELPAILIKAYLEYWKYLDVFQNRSEEANTFVQTKQIQEKAASAYLRSLGADTFKETAVSIFARYNTSAWFWVVKDRAVLKNDLDSLGSKIEDIHWRWAGTEGELAKAREFVNG